jgi:hypothetical protein
MDQWALPEASVRRSVMGAVRHVMDQLRAGISAEDESFQSLDNLPELSAQQQQAFAPEPDFRLQAEALAEHLDQARPHTLVNRDVVFLVGPPFSGIKEMLTVFSPATYSAAQASEKAALIITPPENLLLDDRQAEHWWHQQDLSGYWIIPELADFWLRHVSGLSLVRALLRRISAGDAGQGIIGCSSWCWQFWENYFPDARLTPLVPAALNAEQLGCWLADLSQPGSGSGIVARMTNDGLYVLPMDEEKDGTKLRHSEFLRDLAAMSRGIQGVALAIWQRALRARPDKSAESGAERDNPTDDVARPHCWVVPLNQLSFPVMPQTGGRALGFVLHALLLHDGLDEQTLGTVTGLTEYELGNILSRLARADIIAGGKPKEPWRVTALGYPTARRHLQSWGFPVDSF